MNGPVSQRFGPYVILDRIGDGGMAEIYLAKMQGFSGFEKLIALKTIHPKFGTKEAFRRMLIHEAKLAASLNHLNIVQVHDLGDQDGHVYIAMEYVRGRDLAAVLSNTYARDERLPVDISLYIATEFMAGIEYAHRHRNEDGTYAGIVHRDISPQNILVSFEGAVKVTDFGIARALAGHEDQTGTLHGKFGYMSPEQIKSDDVDQRSDIFSTGIVLWEMLVGKRLFRGHDHKDTLEMILADNVRAPSTINPAVPASIDRICLKSLSQTPVDRYPTMGAMLGELSRAADKLDLKGSARNLSVYMRRQFGTPSGGFRSRQTHQSDPQTITKPLSGVRQTEVEKDERDQIGQILLSQGVINPGQLEVALAEQRANGGLIGELLLSHAAIDDSALAEALATQADLPALSSTDLVAHPPPSELLKRFPKDAAHSSCILPLAVGKDSDEVRLAVCDPYDERALLEAKVVLGVEKVQLSVAPRSAIRAAMSNWYQPRPPSQVPPTDPTECRVLIADADRDEAIALATRLQDEGCTVEVVHDGKLARDAMRLRPPRIAFVDAALPKIDGYNLVLEARSFLTSTTLFVSSQRTDEFSHAKALELGADDFVVKPFQLEVLASKVRREMQSELRPGRSVPAVSGGVSGSLSDMTVIDIAQSLELGRKTAHVTVQYIDGRQGRIRVDAGRVQGCSASNLEGADAFYYLAQPGEGLFRIEYRVSDEEENITEPNTFLIIEAMRLLDEGGVPTPTVEVKVESPHDPVIGEETLRVAASLAEDLHLDDSQKPTSDLRGPRSPKRFAKISLHQHPKILKEPGSQED